MSLKIYFLLHAVLRESVADCLLELNLESLLTESLEEFGDAESSEDYTIFALNDTSLEGVEVPDSLLGYVVDGAFRFEDGMVFPTLAEDVYLHIGKGEEVTINVTFTVSVIMITSSSLEFLCEWSGSYRTQCLSGQEWHRPYREFCHPTVKHDHC